MSKKAKEDRYDWTMVRQPGKFMLLHKGQLVIPRKDAVPDDQAYQRPEENDRVLRIARNFDWALFGVPTVAHRDGVFFTVDGQHRKMAADRRSDVDLLPCMVFEFESLSDEAWTFFKLNDWKNGFSAKEKHDAAIIAGDPLATEMDRIAKKHGYAFTRNGDNRKEEKLIRCVGAFRFCCKKDAAALDAVMPLVIRACDNGAIDQRILRGFHYLKLNATEDITSKRWRERAAKKGKAEYIIKINAMCAAFVQGGDTKFAQGILEVLNFKLQGDDRLRLVGTSE